MVALSVAVGRAESHRNDQAGMQSAADPAFLVEVAESLIAVVPGARVGDLSEVAADICEFLDCAQALYPGDRAFRSASGWHLERVASPLLVGARVDLNAAPRSVLVSLPGIGESRAKRIIRAREDRAFTSLTDLRVRVRGLGLERVQALESLVFFGGMAPALVAATAPEPIGVVTRSPEAGPVETKVAPPALVDLNRATVEALVVLPGIGPARAEAIVWERRRRGDYASVRDLERVPGIGAAIVEKLRPFAQALRY
jgi:competence ComEA-like helix-hairpin-helix protein